MRETFTSGTVGGAPGNRCFYPEMQTIMVVVVHVRMLLDNASGFPNSTFSMY